MEKKPQTKTYMSHSSNYWEKAFWKQDFEMEESSQGVADVWQTTYEEVTL